MNFLASLFLRHKTSRNVKSVAIALRDTAYRYSDGTIGLFPTTCDMQDSHGNIAIIGLNGAGKSTLIHLLSTQYLASEGQIVFEIDGALFDPAKHSNRRDIKQVVGCVSLDHVESHFQRATSIEEALDAYLKRHHVPNDERTVRIATLLEQFDLIEVRHSPLSELDGERRHLLAMAVACARTPALLVADEPMRGLDEISSAHVASRLFAYGRPVIFSTHNVELITHEAYGITRTLVMDESRIVFDGTPVQAAEFYTQLIRNKYQSIASRK